MVRFCYSTVLFFTRPVNAYWKAKAVCQKYAPSLKVIFCLLKNQIMFQNIILDQTFKPLVIKSTFSFRSCEFSIGHLTQMSGLNFQPRLLKL